MSVATIKRPWPIKPPQGVGLNRAAPQASGLEGFWTFREGAGPTIHDAMHGRNATQFGAATWVVNPPGRGLLLGAGGYLNCGDHAQYNPAQITVMVRFRHLAAGGFRSLIFRANAVSSFFGAWNLALLSNRVLWEGQAPSAGQNWTAQSPLLVDGRTYTAIATQDGDVANLYLDGEWVASDTPVYGPPQYSATQRPLLIGATPLESGVGDYFTGGTIYTVGLWGRAMSPAEVWGWSTSPHAIYAPRRVFVPLGGGGTTTHNVTLAESLTATSTLASILTTSHGITESAVASDTVVGTIDAGGEVVEKAITEAVDAAASLSTTITVRGVVDYTAAAGDSPAATMTAEGAVNHTANAADLQANTITVEGAVSYAVAAAEAGAVTVTINASVGFSVEAAVNLAANAILNASIAESAAISVTFDHGAVITITPGDRVWTIPAESRVWTIPSESRSWSIPAEDRTWAISA